MPTQLWRLLAQGFDHPAPGCESCCSGAPPSRRPPVNRLTALGLEPKVSYGLSEMGSQVCTGQPRAAGVVGSPAAGAGGLHPPGGSACGETLFAGYFREGQSWCAPR